MNNNNAGLHMKQRSKFFRTRKTVKLVPDTGSSAMREVQGELRVIVLDKVIVVPIILLILSTDVVCMPLTRHLKAFSTMKH